MRLKKLLVNSLITGILSIAMLPSFANLHIVNNSNISTFKVACSGPYPGVDIHNHQSAEFDWTFVEMVIGGLDGSCSFYSGGKLEATARILISPTLTGATITELNIEDPNLRVTSNPGVLTASSNISVVVTSVK